MNFIPEQPKQVSDVPYFEDVTSEGGWQGHTTQKSIDKLKSEIIEAITRLGGNVTSFQRGTFQIGEVDRQGFQIDYFLEAANGNIVKGRVDIAALPNRNDYRIRSSFEKRKLQSIKMALYMFRNAMEGLWFMQQLSPGYAGLIPWMLTEGSDKTLTQQWSEYRMMDNLLPPGDADFIEEEIVDAKIREI